MAGEHAHKATSWVVVALIVVASIVLGFAFVAAVDRRWPSSAASSASPAWSWAASTGIMDDAY